MKYFYSIVVFIAIASCQKDQNGTVPPPAKTKYEKLLGTWKFVSFKEGNMFLTNADSCLADNLMVFKTDTTVYLSQGTCLEAPTEVKEEDLGKWSFGAEDILKLRGNDIKIFRLNDTALWFGGDGAKPYEYRWKR
jgi:hypothetical protein